MRVAFLTPTVPWPANTGGTMRTFHLLRGLAQRHLVDLFCFHYGPQPALGPLPAFCRQVKSIQLSPIYSRHRQLLDLVSQRPRSVSYFTTNAARLQLGDALVLPYDLIVCDEIMMTPYLDPIGQKQTARQLQEPLPPKPLPPQPLPPALLLRPKVDHVHYAEMAAERGWGSGKLLDLIEARRLRRYETTVLPRYSHAIVCSQDDHAITKDQLPALPVDIIPNGADTAYFQPDRQPATAPTILLLGTMHYYPNIDGVRHFFELIYPSLQKRFPDLQVLIVGHQPPPEVALLANHPGVTVTGSVDDVRPFMAHSWVMAVPLRLGGGTRLKIVEALAAGLPVVSTTIGAQGLAVTDGEEILLADKPADFVAALERLLTTPALAQHLSINGRALVESTYSWQRLGNRFAAICEQIGHP